MDIEMDALLEKTHEMKASDLHITVGLPPVLRINGKLLRVGDLRLTAEDTERMVKSMLTQEQFDILNENGEVDCSISATHRYRFRVNCFRQRGSYAIALRHIDSAIKTIDELHLPEILKSFTHKNQGIVLVTGPTGSGKSTTLAAMIDLINSQRECHIITLEDPIEYLHKHNKSIINQREIGGDSKNYHNALRAALREDPDVILIGEMRDYDSISIALTAAETGHLVFSTLHTIGAAKTIDRIIDVFPPSQQQQIRVQLSMALSGVISQQLIPNINGNGRRVAVEVMVNNPAIRNLIRESKTPQLNNAIATGKAQGMISMDNSLLELYHDKAISYEELMLRCIDTDYVIQSINRF